MADIWFQGSEDKTMVPRFASVNGMNIAYRITGDGPPLVLVMGYRLNSTAWPASFIEQLARQFTVITLDNRGTGLSDKPVKGYAIANMARDLCGLLDELEIPRAHILGYSMGGAIAQEFVRQFPERISRLILCATMAGGPDATYASTSVVSVMRDLDGLSPEQAARRIWNVTYAPHYLHRHRTIAEEQMRREIALPTPLHAADLQFQAFAEFDGSNALANIRCPTLVLTGDLDELISAQNSRKIAKVIPGARLIVIPGRGHRVMWEATEECVSLIAQFLNSTGVEHAARHPQINGSGIAVPADALLSSAALIFGWPSMLAGAALEALTLARQSIMVGSASRFGDGKPVVLIPHHLGSDFALLPVSNWLKALGYRPATAGLVLNLSDMSSERALSQLILDVTTRIGRKAVLVTHSSGASLASRVAELQKERVSDVVVFDPLHRPKMPRGVRNHSISSGWSALQAVAELPRLLRTIGIELLDDQAATASDVTAHRDIEPIEGNPS
jgi:pimeloyl-ACP methyl ester carboxylesterase